jgi:hypothetical protein
MVHGEIQESTREHYHSPDPGEEVQSIIPKATKIGASVSEVDESFCFVQHIDTPSTYHNRTMSLRLPHQVTVSSIAASLSIKDSSA